MNTRMNTIRPPETESLASYEIEEKQENKIKATLKRYATEFRQFVILTVKSSAFNWFIMVIIFLNATTISMETSYLKDTIPLFFLLTNQIFLGIYLMEFLIKLYAEPLGYWKSYYNIFDFIIFIIAIIDSIFLYLNLGQNELALLQVVKALIPLRTLRLISLSQGLQLLVKSLVKTIKSFAFNLLLLLLTFMFIFALIGYYLFGYETNGDETNWGNLGRSLLTLFTYMTVDGWLPIQKELTAHGFVGSEIFTVIFIFLGHYIFTNLFVGVLIANIHLTTTKFKAQKMTEKRALIQSKKKAVIDKQHKDVMEMLKKQRENNYMTLNEMTKEFEKSLRHDDFTYTTDLCTTVTWIETMLASLKHLENSKHKCHQIQFEIAEVLAEMKGT
uniref:Ion transport domain-containing protein n=2 Tax=Amphimedon queenslandica TaxID=400682 RepID=A0A1X7UK09_AMPQE